jgi:SAM domain (Sterile alpha motif)
MTDLGTQLERLGLEQYVDAFVGEGFDAWETLLDIQESDLFVIPSTSAEANADWKK